MVIAQGLFGFSWEAWQAFGAVASAIFALALIVVAYWQWKTYERQVATSRLIERAYVGFGTWLNQSNCVDGRRKLLMTLQLFNFGNTPARIERVVVARHFGHSIVDQDPPYSDPISIPPTKIFLVRHGEFVFRNLPFTIPEDQWDRVNSAPNDRAETMWLLGYIWYRDTFGQLHRARYARVFDKGSDGPTVAEFGKLPKTEYLRFATEPGFNEDREIENNGQPKDAS